MRIGDEVQEVRPLEADSLVEPFDGHVALSRNATELSLCAEGIVATFVRYRAASATVRWERTPYSIDELCRGLRNVCRKAAFSQLVEVHKTRGQIVLVRKPPRAAERKS